MTTTMELEHEPELPTPELPFNTLKEISNEKDVEERIMDLRSSLSNEDWNIRLKALQHLSSLIKEKKLDFFPGYINLIIEHLSLPLASQIEDRRSILCKEACETTSLLASHLGGEKFQPIAEVVWPVLMKLLIITIKIMATSGEQCVHSFLPLLTPSYSLSFLNNESFDAHPGMRAGVANCVSIILRNASKEELEKDNAMENASNLIRKAVCDSNPVSRTHGRTAFELFKGLNSEKADALFSTLPVPTQKQLQTKLAAAPVSNGKPSLVQRKPLGKPNIKEFIKQQKTSKTEEESLFPVSSVDVPKPDPTEMEIVSPPSTEAEKEAQKTSEMSSLEEDTTSLTVSDPVTPRKRNSNARTEEQSQAATSVPNVIPTETIYSERPATPVIIHEKKPKVIPLEEVETVVVPPGKENLANPKEAEQKEVVGAPKKKISARVAKIITYEKGSTPIAKRLRSATRKATLKSSGPVEPLDLEPLQIEGKKAPTSPRTVKKKASPRV
eukprot:TRINITY_DN2325_c0_g1_i1.p1 TRINITY_DN2325_c0_g1~~TRINITY_DN2325_c0_g1_i1.p1  ORF type:complete len:499 (-),score=161.76 TRINITY_DN2325_c0_g1_i1:37-1533(-)